MLCSEETIRECMELFRSGSSRQEIALAKDVNYNTLVGWIARFIPENAEISGKRNGVGAGGGSGTRCTSRFHKAAKARHGDDRDNEDEEKEEEENREQTNDSDCDC